MGHGSDDAGSSSVPEDLRSFPGDGASVLVSSGGSLAGDTVRVTVRSEDVGVLGPLAPKKSSGSQYEFFNALQVKFSYAITCHKSQGGQWNTVFIEQPYLPEGIDRDYIRWLYTAITRAKDKLYLIGFKDECFLEN